MMNWISVNDRLPETDGESSHKYDVLVYIPKRDGTAQHGIYIGKLLKVEPDTNGSGNFWRYPTPGSPWTVWGWSYFEKPIITHWMPLPELPVEKEDAPKKPVGEEYSNDRFSGGWDCSDEEYNYSGYVRDVLNAGW